MDDALNDETEEHDDGRAEIIATTPVRRVKSPLGRTRKLFMPVVTEKILDAVRSGATQALAAQYAGISAQTLATWLKEAEEVPEDDPLYAFYVAYHRARGEKAKMTLERIKEIGDSINSWQAHAWILEHSFPKEFGRGAFGGDPNETPEIKHVIEIKRESGDAAPELTEGMGTTMYQLSGPENGTGDDGDVTDFPRVSPAD